MQMRVDVDSLISQDAVGLVHVHLEPQQVELLQQFGNAFGGFRLEVEVQVEIDVHVGPHGVPEGADQGLDVPQELPGYHLVGRAGAAAKASEVDLSGVARQHDVGLEGGVTPADDLPAQVGYVVHRPNGGRPQHVRVPGP